MGQHIELAKKRLYDADSLAATNVKLYPGTSRDTSAEQFAEQINKAISQIEAGDYEVVNLEDSPT